MRKIIVAGGRDFDDYYTLRDVLDRHMLGRGEVSLVSGHARGVDQMAEVADELVAIWDGKSRGTAAMIHMMRRRKKPVTVYDYNGNIREDK